MWAVLEFTRFRVLEWAVLGFRVSDVGSIRVYKV
jgi:hypothetical protein